MIGNNKKILIVYFSASGNIRGYSESSNNHNESGNVNKIVFRSIDMEIPFISFDDNMWNYFEPELNRRLSDLDVDDSFCARVRAALTELLPAGICGIEEVADELGLSKRTLQSIGHSRFGQEKDVRCNAICVPFYGIKPIDMVGNKEYPIDIIV